MRSYTLRCTFAAILMASSFSPSAFAQNALALKTLSDQAKFWSSKGRSDLAAAAWQRLLLLDPNNREALLELIQFETENNRLASAKDLTARLKKSGDGNGVEVKKAEAAMQRPPVNPEFLENARSAAKSGNAKLAVDFYGKYFQGRPLKGPVALEYLQTMGGLPDKWDEVRSGLQTLLEQDSDNDRVNLAYAQHLTYNPATIRDGIAILVKIARSPDVGSSALDSLRKALSWLPANEDDIPLFKTYLGFRPGDEATADRIRQLSQMKALRRAGSAAAVAGRSGSDAEAVRKPDPSALALGQGYAALAAGAFDAAEKAFSGLLTSTPRSPDALGAMGLVRMRQQRLAEAEAFFADANRFSGGKAWRQALDSVRFWKELDAGDQARAAGNSAKARAHYEAAAKLDDRHERPLYSLINLWVDEGRLSDAESAYKKLLEEYPDSLDVRRGYVQVLMGLNKADQALAIVRDLSDDEKEELGYGLLMSRYHQLKAEKALAQGDKMSAMQSLEDALLLESDNPWLRLQLARLYKSAGADREAAGLLDSLLKSSPDSPDVRYSAALISADAKDWAMGLMHLEKIPVASRTKEMVKLQRGMWVNAQIEGAKYFRQTGQIAEANRLLERARDASFGDDGLVSAVALGSLELGNEPLALGMMRGLLAKKTNNDVGLTLKYAGLLLNARQDVELAGLIRHLYKQPLTQTQRMELDDIRWVYSVRQVDAQRESGNIAGGYEIATQLLSERREDAAVQEALARLYSAGGEHGLALAWYNQLLQKKPEDVPLLTAAGTAALQAGDLKYAKAALDSAAGIAPANADVLAALGRLARVQGNHKLALAYLERARAVSALKVEVESAGALQVGLVDYAVPSQANTAGQNGTSRDKVPLIPNPVGRTGGAAVTPPVPTFIERPTVNSPQAPDFLELKKSTDVNKANMRPVQFRIQEKADNNLFGDAGTDLPSMAPLIVIPEKSNPPTERKNNALTGRLLAPAGYSSRSATVASDSRRAGKSVDDPLQGEIDSLRAGASASLAGGLGWQRRSGDAGMSQMTNISMALENRFSAGDNGHLVLRLEPVFLSAGTLNSSSTLVSQQFGTNAFANITGATGTVRSQEDEGIGLSVGYETPGLKLDLGTTPLGFTLQNVVGGVTLRESWSDMKIDLTLSRRAVTDSLLSYAGALDDNSGLKWGGVTATGGRLQIGTEDGPLGFYGYGGAHALRGQNVQNNSRLEFGAGAYYRVLERTDFSVTTGLNLTAMGYQRNLRYFTLGHGGYFSPQRYISLGVPLEVSGRNGRMAYRVDGAISLQNLRESSAAYFPGDPDRQANWESVVAANKVAQPTATWNTFYQGQSKTGVGLRLGGEAEYSLSSQWAIGGQFNFDKSADFSINSGLIYVKYHFEPIRTPVAFPPRVLKVGN